MFDRVFHESPAERARHYETLALTSEANAAAAELPQMREAYLRSAERWHLLASLMGLGGDYAPRKIARSSRARQRQSPAAQESPVAAAAE